MKTAVLTIFALSLFGSPSVSKSKRDCNETK
jgi:hypothetical protein